MYIEVKPMKMSCILMPFFLLQGQLQQVCEHGYMIRRNDYSSFPNLYGTQRVGNTKYHYQAFMIGIRLFECRTSS